MAEEAHPVPAHRSTAVSIPGAAALLTGVSRYRGAFPDWFGVLRTVMMVLGGVVVIATVLVVAIAVISGVIGMMGNLGKRSEKS
jgi:uncharacterized protein involved in cysteine biosynthesis